MHQFFRTLHFGSLSRIYCNRIHVLRNFQVHLIFAELVTSLKLLQIESAKNQQKGKDAMILCAHLEPANSKNRT